jgi:hypothetical protein
MTQSPDPSDVPHSSRWDDYMGNRLLPSDKEQYAETANGPVSFHALREGDLILGYLWWSDGENAADYLGELSAAPRGFAAGPPWRLALERAKARGLSPSDAVKEFRSHPPRTNRGVLDTQQQEAASFAELRRISGRQI